jgi:hypothetical protein
MLIKSNKGYSNIPPLQNIIQDEGLEEIVYGDDEELFLLQILTNIWELHLAAMLNGIYMLKIYC